MSNPDLNWFPFQLLFTSLVILLLSEMAQRHYDHDLQLNQAVDASSELDQVSFRLKKMKLAHASSELDQVSLRLKRMKLAHASSELDQVSGGLKRTKLVHDMAVTLPQDIVRVITEMVAMDTHEKDPMLPNMSKFLWWSISDDYSFFPVFGFPSHIFQPKWFEAGLVAVQTIDQAKNQHIRQLLAVVRYVMSKYTNLTRYCPVNITSTLMERSRDDPLKIYYPYQIWEIQPSFYKDADIPERSPKKINEDQDSERWENYWSNPLKARVSRVEAFVRELEMVVQWSEELWIFFDGRIVVTLPRNWVYHVNLDKSRSGYQDCKSLLRQFQGNPKSLNLPPEVRTQLSIASRN